MHNNDKRNSIISSLIKAKRAAYAGKGAETVTCDIEGDFEWFQGKETIRYNGVVIYECYFHGGLIE